MTVGGPLPLVADEIGRRLFRHVTTRDLVPALPPAAWGAFTHFGKEYRYTNGEWQRSAVPVAQLVRIEGVPRSLAGVFRDHHAARILSVLTCRPWTAPLSVRAATG